MRIVSFLPESVQNCFSPFATSSLVFSCQRLGCYTANENYTHVCVCHSVSKNVILWTNLRDLDCVRVSIRANRWLTDWPACYYLQQWEKQPESNFSRLQTRPRTLQMWSPLLCDVAGRAPMIHCKSAHYHLGFSFSWLRENHKHRRIATSNCFIAWPLRVPPPLANFSASHIFIKSRSAKRELFTKQKMENLDTAEGEGKNRKGNRPDTRKPAESERVRE